LTVASRETNIVCKAFLRENLAVGVGLSLEAFSVTRQATRGTMDALQTPEPYWQGERAEAGCA
jgi:hypothetical protein